MYRVRAAACLLLFITDLSVDIVASIDQYYRYCLLPLLLLWRRTAAANICAVNIHTFKGMLPAAIIMDLSVDIVVGVKDNVAANICAVFIHAFRGCCCSLPSRRER